MLVLSWPLTCRVVHPPAVLRAGDRPGRRPSGGGSRRRSRARWPTSRRWLRSRCRCRGVLLAKTMGQGGELTDRSATESRLLADLEIRQRMTGRWVMASLQTAFAVMPALVYLFAGHAMAAGITTVSIGTLAAFTTPQTRLFFPVGSLLGVQADVQTSLALFERIFEYLDQPIDIAEPEHPVPLPPAPRRSGIRPTSRSLYQDEPAHAPPTSSFNGRAGHQGGRRRRDGQRQDDARLSGRAPRTTRSRAACRSTASMCATCCSPTSRAWSGWCRRRRTCSTAPSARTCASPAPTRPTRN